MPTKNLIAVVVGVVIGLIGVEVALRILDPWIPSPSAWPTASTHVKTDQLSGLAPDIEILLLGSSITEAAVDPEVLEEHAGRDGGYNAAIPFFSPFIAETWLDPILSEAEFSPRMAIIGLPVFPGHTENSARSLAASIEDAQGREEEKADWFFPAVLTYRDVFARWDRLLTWEAARQQQLWTESGHFTGYHSGQSQAGDISALAPQRRLSARDEASLRNLIDLFQSKGATVALVIEPGRHPDPVDPEVIHAFIDSIEELARETETRFWNAYGVDWPDGLYTDPFHFNKEGMHRYTARISDRIAQWVESPAERATKSD